MMILLANDPERLAALEEKVDGELESYLDESAEIEASLGMEGEASQRFRTIRTNAFRRGFKIAMESCEEILAALAEGEDEEPKPVASVTSAPLDPDAPPSLLGIKRESYSILEHAHTVNRVPIWVQPSSVMEIIKDPTAESGRYEDDDQKSLVGEAYLDTRFTFTRESDSVHTLNAMLVYDPANKQYVALCVIGAAQNHTRLLPKSQAEGRFESGYCVARWVDELPSDL